MYEANLMLLRVWYILKCYFPLARTESHWKRTRRYRSPINSTIRQRHTYTSPANTGSIRGGHRAATGGKLWNILNGSAAYRLSRGVDASASVFPGTETPSRQARCFAAHFRNRHSSLISCQYIDSFGRNE